MFDRLGVASIPAVYRRTTISAILLGIVALVLCTISNQALVGIGACIGLGLGILNIRMLGNSVAKIGARPGENKRRPVALNSLGRLALLSVITVGLLFVAFGLGFGALAGLAVFEAIMLTNVFVVLLRSGGVLPGVVDNLVPIAEGEPSDGQSAVAEDLPSGEGVPDSEGVR